MMKWLLARWVADERGQDVIEYALLCSFLGFAAWAGVAYLSSAMNSTYSIWDSVGQSNALVEVPDPQ
jgi:Flp pilus assembly pilin Flp